MLGDVGAYWWQDDVTRTRDEATYAKKTAGARNWEPLGGSNGRTRLRVGGGVPPYKSPDWRLQTPTPTGTGDSDSNCISRLRLQTELDEWDDWELDKLDDGMIG